MAGASQGHGRAARLFVDALPAEGETLALPAVAVQHVRVLRLSAGDTVDLFDGSGGVATAELLARGRVVCGSVRHLPRPSSELSVLIALPKGQKLDGVVRMLTELGVDGVHLVQSERSVPVPGGFGGRLERLLRIAREACGQSQQPRVPRIHAPQPLMRVAAAAPGDARRFLFWEHARSPLPAALEGTPSQVWAIVGPEGGLSDSEARALSEMGYGAVGLGRGVLRAETAAVAIATLLLDRMGRLRHGE